MNAQRMVLIGPLPPPAGGMARQAEQQQSLLKQEGVDVQFIQTNLPYTPLWVGSIPVLRAVFRLMHFLILLLVNIKRQDVVHVMANSGWSWYLFAVPAIVIARLKTCRIILNYRGGDADPFFSASWGKIKPVIQLTDQVIVPSGYLKDVFKKYGVEATVIPNTLNRDEFKPSETLAEGPSILLFARNLEPIYGPDIALRAFAELKNSHPDLLLEMTGEGPSRHQLEMLAKELGVFHRVRFLGRLSKAEMVAAYQRATLLINPSLTDNSPNALIEAMSCGLPIVTSDAGGIPYLVTDGETGLICTTPDASEYATLLDRLLRDAVLRGKLRGEGFDCARKFDRNTVIQQWMEKYFSGVSMPTQPVKSTRAFTDRFYTRLAAGLIFPLHERLKKHTTVSVKHRMEASQWLSTAEIKDHQIAELRTFLAKVQSQVPYFTDLFHQEGFNPLNVTQLSDLQSLPFMTKSVIRENTEQLKSIKATSLSKFNTGGSSGEPLIFYIGKERVSHDVAAKWRATRWWNVDIGDKEIVLWGSPIELGKQDKIKAIRDRLLRTELISAFNLTTETKNHILEKIQSRKPPMLFGYPSVYYLLAQYAQEQKRDMSHCGVEVIFVTSERLYDHQRALIKKVFNAPVANGYGGRDAGFIAHECPEGSLHITAEDIIVEIIDDNGQVLPAGESGEIVVTHLRTTEFPFIRYRTGDIGTLATEPCQCGRGLPVLANVEGRTTDFIIAADGTQMHGLALIYHVREVEGVKNFKIEQESRQKTILHLEVETSFQEAAQQQIIENFKKRLGQGVEIEVNITDRIPAEKSGKFRYVVSRVTA